tara:strand:+ start:55 stop:1455 length:1401 start_codon:yes stop_codon:yes gene_type:complete
VGVDFNMTKKKILLMSDDLRMHSGIATVSRDIVLETLHKYDWAQIGGAISHPEDGKIVDMNQSVREELGVKDGYLKIYPVNGYGNPDVLREILRIEKPDAILHYTDPRFWLWFYNMEHEIRTKIPIFYYNIWDDLPDPMWNENFYRSCDLLMAISKQTYGINKRILSDYEDWQIAYVPHGINPKKFFKINKNNSNFREFEKKFSFDRYSFKVLYSNRNIRRKQPGDVVLAFKHFVDQLPEEKQKECVLVFHCAPVDENGTDIPEVCRNMIPKYNVIFTHHISGPFDDIQMNYLFNSIDVYINLASNEGFGLGSCEALSVDKPIVVNVTGGLQDQCGFRKMQGNGEWEYYTPDDYIDYKSNHDRSMGEHHGEWTKPVWPSNISLQGSPATPYIFDDRCQYQDAGNALKHWYDMGAKERERCGSLGYKFVKNKVIGMDSKEMGKRFIDSMDTAFEKWTPKARYTLEAV